MINLPTLEYLAVISVCQNSVLHSESYLHINNSCQDLSVCKFVCRSVRHTLRSLAIGGRMQWWIQGGARDARPSVQFLSSENNSRNNIHPARTCIRISCFRTTFRNKSLDFLACLGHTLLKSHVVSKIWIII